MLHVYQDLVDRHLKVENAPVLQSHPEGEPDPHRAVVGVSENSDVPQPSD